MSIGQATMYDSATGSYFAVDLPSHTHSHSFFPPSTSIYQTAFPEQFPPELVRELFLNKLTDEQRVRREALEAMGIPVCYYCEEVCKFEGEEAINIGEVLCKTCSTLVASLREKATRKQHIHTTWEQLAQQAQQAQQAHYQQQALSNSFTSGGAPGAENWPSTTTGTATLTWGSIGSATTALVDWFKKS